MLFKRDFEKAYDCMDWDFLEGTLSQFGFEDSWIRGVAGLYCSVTSKVLLVGGRGPSHNQLDRVVCWRPSYFCSLLRL